MRRILAAAFGVAAYALLFASTAYAGPTWCENDPVFVVEGSTIDVTTGFAWESLPYAKSATFELQVPTNVSAHSLTVPALIPITTKVSKVLAPWDGRGNIQVVALVTVSGTLRFPISTRVIGTYGELASWTEGTSNKTQKLGFSLIR